MKKVAEMVKKSTRTEKAKVKQKDWWKVPNLVGDSHIDKCSIESAIRKVGRKSQKEWDLHLIP